MTLPLPSTFKAQLSSDNLQTVANWLLEEYYATLDDLTRSTDDSYSLGCTTFGRQKNRIFREHHSQQHTWLTSAKGGNAIVFEIGGIPCRFSNDDPANPSKDAVLLANRYQQDFFESVDQDEPGRFCFIIDRGHDESAEPSVVFLGYTSTNTIACKWQSTDKVRVFRVEGQSLAQPVDIAKPQIAPKRRDEGDATAPVAV
jgi:hypothetical protein